MSAQEIALALIKADVRAQPRAAVLPAKIEEYRDEMAAGDVFPPVVVFQDGDLYWLADGFHRFGAAQSIGVETIACDVREGGLRDAILYSCGANADHGLKRSNEDKRRAVVRLLEDEEWRAWSDSDLGRRAAVSHDFVRRIRASLASDASEGELPAERTYKTKHGTTARMNTAAIGKARLSQPNAPPPASSAMSASPGRSPDVRDVPEIEPPQLKLASAGSPAGLPPFLDENEDLRLEVARLKSENDRLRAENAMLRETLEKAGAAAAPVRTHGEIAQADTWRLNPATNKDLITIFRVNRETCSVETISGALISLTEQPQGNSARFVEAAWFDASGNRDGVVAIAPCLFVVVQGDHSRSPFPRDPASFDQWFSPWAQAESITVLGDWRGDVSSAGAEPSGDPDGAENPIPLFLRRTPAEPLCCKARDSSQISVTIPPPVPSASGSQ